MVPARDGLHVTFLLRKRRGRTQYTHRPIEYWTPDGSPLVVGRRGLVSPDDLPIDDREVVDWWIDDAGNQEPDD